MHPSDALASQLIEVLGLPQHIEKLVLTFQVRKPVEAEVTFFPHAGAHIATKQRFECVPVQQCAVGLVEASG